MIKTPVCDMLGIKYPVFQGGMAWVSDFSLASAVSNAGGLGVIAAMNMDGSYLKDEIDRCRELLEDATIPFGVNVMLMSPFADEVAGTVIEKQVPVVITGAGMPSKYIKDWVAAGIKVIPVVPSTAIARMVVRMGAMAVIAEGGESGGHVGDLTTVRRGEHNPRGLRRRHSRRPGSRRGANAWRPGGSVRDKVSYGI